MNGHTMNPEIEKARQELEKLKQRERELEERLGSMYAGKYVTEVQNGDTSPKQNHIEDPWVEDNNNIQYSNLIDHRSNGYTDLAKAVIDKKAPITIFNRKSDVEELEKRYPYPAKKNGEPKRLSFDNVSEDEDLMDLPKTDNNNNNYSYSHLTNNSIIDINDDIMLTHHNHDIINTDVHHEDDDLEGHFDEYESETYGDNILNSNTDFLTSETDYLHHKDETINSSTEMEDEIDDGIVDLRHDIHREIQINQQRERELKYERNMVASSENSSDSDNDSIKSCISIRSKILKEIEEERQRDMEIQDQHRMRGLIPVQIHENSDYTDSLDGTLKNSDSEETYDNDDNQNESSPLDVNYSADDNDSLRSKDDEIQIDSRSSLDNEWLRQREEELNRLRRSLRLKDEEFQSEPREVYDNDWLRQQREEELNRLRRVLSQDDMLGAETRDSESELGEPTHNVDMRTKILKEIEEEQNREKELRSRIDRELKITGVKVHEEIETGKQVNGNINGEIGDLRIIDESHDTTRDLLNEIDDTLNARSLNDIDKQIFGSRDDLVAYLGTNTDKLQQSPTLKKKKKQTVQRITIPKVFTTKTNANKINKQLNLSIKDYSKTKHVHETTINTNLVEKQRSDTNNNEQELSYYNTIKDDLDRATVPILSSPVKTLPTMPPTIKKTVPPINTVYKKTGLPTNTVSFSTTNSIPKSFASQLDTTSKKPISQTNSSPKKAPMVLTLEKTTLSINDRSKGSLYFDKDEGSNNLNMNMMYNKYNNSNKTETQQQHDEYEEHKRKESDTSILSHDVNKDEMDKYEKPITPVTSQRLNDSQPITKQWNKVEGQQKIEAALQNKVSSQRKKEKYTKSFYEKASPDIHPRKRHQSKTDPSYNSQTRHPIKPTTGITKQESPKKEASTKLNYGNQHSPKKVPSKTTINFNLAEDMKEVAKDMSKGKTKEHVVQQSPTKTNGYRNEKPITDIESKDAPNNIPPKAKAVTVSFTISKTIQRWEKRIKKNT